MGSLFELLTPFFSFYSGIRPQNFVPKHDFFVITYLLTVTPPELPIPNFLPDVQDKACSVFLGSSRLSPLFFKLHCQSSFFPDEMFNGFPYTLFEFPPPRPFSTFEMLMVFQVTYAPPSKPPLKFCEAFWHKPTTLSSPRRLERVVSDARSLGLADLWFTRFLSCAAGLPEP